METIVTFRIYGGGKKEFFGEYTLTEVIEKVDNKVCLVDRDEKGRFCHPYLADNFGNVVCETPKSKTGILDLDGDYETYVCEVIRDCSNDELELIQNDRYATDYLKDVAIKQITKNTLAYLDKIKNK